MFGSKQSPTVPATSSEIPDESLRIHTIPKAFYGKTISAADAAPTPDQMNPQAGATPRGAAPSGATQVTSTGSVFDTPGPGASAQIAHAPTHASKMKIVLWSGLGVLVLAVAGTATWMYTRTPEPSPVIDVPPVVVTQENEEIPPQESIAIPTSTTDVVTPPTVDPDMLLAIAPVGDTIDFDGDGLTDIEEELYKTDPAIADTDLDTFTDGVELTNLFDPLVEAPAMLMDSPNIQLYTNPVHNYSVVHPSDWLAAPVDERTSDELTFTSLTGEFVTIQAFPLKENELFVSWFAAHNQSYQYSGLTSWANRRGVTGWYEASFMRFYFVDAKSVYVMEYHPGIRNAVNFRRSVRMMAESFAFTEELMEGPEEVIEPVTTSTPATTTTTTTTSTPTVAVPETTEPTATSTTP